MFQDVEVVLAVLGGQSSAFVCKALQDAGASLRVTSQLAGPPPGGDGTCATVVFDPLVITEHIHAGLQAWSRLGPVVVVTFKATTRERIALLNSGADSVLASVDPGEVVAALAAALRRSRLPTTGQVRQMVWAGEIRVHPLRRTASAAGRTLALTPLEFDLLAYFVAHAGEALSRDRLLRDVWGYDIGGRETVTVHVRRLRRKLETDPSRPTRLQTVWGIGYRLNPDVMTEPVLLRTFLHETAARQRRQPSSPTLW